MLNAEAGLRATRYHSLRHTVITGLAEMGVADHPLESISGHLSRRMLDTAAAPRHRHVTVCFCRARRLPVNC